jgi:hypothetical protein
MDFVYYSDKDTTTSTISSKVYTKISYKNFFFIYNKKKGIGGTQSIPSQYNSVRLGSTLTKIL